jgi:acetylornithine aminotransferase
MTLAKGLGNGVPIGACLAKGRAADVLGPGTHGSTFGGNPLACRAALAVLETLDRDDLVENAAYMGDRLLEGFRQALGGTEGVRNIRGIGLMLGIELDRPGGDLVPRALERGLLINVTGERVVRLLPPLILEQKEADLIVEQVSSLVTTLLDEPASPGA